MKFLRPVLFVVSLVGVGFLLWFNYEFAAHMPWIFAIATGLCLYFIFFSYRLLFCDGLRYYARGAWFHSFLAPIPLAFFGMGLCGIVILNLMLASHDSPKAFVSDPSSEERLRFAYAWMKAAVLITIPAATAVFTLRSAASRPAFFAGAAVLAGIGAFRHTNVHLSPQGSMVGFTLSLTSIEWLFASLPVIIAIMFFFFDRSQRKVA